LRFLALRRNLWVNSGKNEGKFEAEISVA